jgi:hypothetical protein
MLCWRMRCLMIRLILPQGCLQRAGAHGRFLIVHVSPHTTRWPVVGRARSSSCTTVLYSSNTQATVVALSHLQAVGALHWLWTVAIECVQSGGLNGLTGRTPQDTGDR